MLRISGQGAPRPAVQARPVRRNLELRWREGKEHDGRKKKQGWGDVWTWVAFDADTKLVPCWLVGTRDASVAYHFIHDLKDRLANRVQLTTDGHRAYVSAVEDAFGCEVDYAMLIKLYGEGASEGQEVRDSPAQCTGTRRAVLERRALAQAHFHVVRGAPEPDDTDADASFYAPDEWLSKKLANHEAAIALHYMHYNFARVHQTLRVTPAMEAGVADHVWTIEEIIGLL